MKEGEGLREWRLSLAADGMAAGEEEAEVEDGHTDPVDQHRQCGKDQQLDRSMVSRALHRVVSREEAEGRLVVDLLKAVART